MNDKLPILILFPDSHLPYSPTVLNLYHILKDEFTVTILNFESRQYNKIPDPGIHYITIPFFLKKFYGLFNRYSKDMGMRILAYIKRYLVKGFLKGRHFDHYIVTDPIGLWMIDGLKLQNLHLLSLELTFNTIFFIKKVNLDRISSIVIQSKERLAYLANGFTKPVFLVQNAPVYKPGLINDTLVREKNHFIFSGTAAAKFGIFSCLEFLNRYTDYKMTIIGNVPAEELKIIQRDYLNLIEENRLIIPGKYLEAEEMIKTVSEYEVGFCFYDFNFPEINNINYKTAPSGKMFTYFAAGVPVIGIDIPGLNPVSEFNAGVLIKNLQPETIYQAMKMIQGNYESMKNGCKEAALNFNFEKMAIPFIEFLKMSN